MKTVYRIILEYKTHDDAVASFAAMWQAGVFGEADVTLYKADALDARHAHYDDYMVKRVGDRPAEFQVA